jgi:hypothetical protein
MLCILCILSTLCKPLEAFASATAIASCKVMFQGSRSENGRGELTCAVAMRGSASAVIVNTHVSTCLLLQKAAVRCHAIAMTTSLVGGSFAQAKSLKLRESSEAGSQRQGQASRLGGCGIALDSNAAVSKVA